MATWSKKCLARNSYLPSTKLSGVSAYIAASVWQCHQLLNIEQPFLLWDAECSWTLSNKIIFLLFIALSHCRCLRWMFPCWFFSSFEFCLFSFNVLKIFSQASFENIFFVKLLHTKVLERKPWCLAVSWDTHGCIHVAGTVRSPTLSMWFKKKKKLHFF